MTKEKPVFLILIIFCFAFLLRASLVFHNPYPPSSDIGFHGSIINLIIKEQTLPTWNPYHMGGEPLVTPPGFHFFVSILIMLTGLPVTLAQILVASFFSAIIVFPVYNLSKKIWKNKNACLIASFFVAISALSIEMLTWGGYSNIVSLFLIVSIFYLFLKDIDNPSLKHLVPGTLLVGAVIVTHTFSLAVCLPILGLYIILLALGKLRKIKEINIMNTLRFFIVSVALGVVTVSPWILRVFRFYINASTQGAVTGGLENKNIILANCKIEPITLTLIILVIPTLLMLKRSRKKYVDQSSLLLIIWFLVPVIMTQAYLFGIYTHYSRFLYFVDFPLIIIISAILLYLAQISTSAINKIIKFRFYKIKKILPIITCTLIIFVYIIFSSWSLFPHQGLKEANTYSTILQPEATTLEWIKKSTPEKSVFIADHQYGWWISGISQRPTLSAAGLEFLLYSHEIEAAKNAQLLLDTNYYIDNGLIQVRDDGPYLSRHNPEISIATESGEAYPIFQFNETQLEYSQKIEFLANMTITENTITKNENSTVQLTMKYENELFKVKKTLRIQQDVRFVELNYELQTKNALINDFGFGFSVFSEANQNLTLIESSKTKQLRAYDSHYKLAGQIIFIETYPEIRLGPNSTNYAQIRCSSQNNSMTIKMLIGGFNSEKLFFPEGIMQMFDKLAENPLEKTSSNNEISVWKYTDMLEELGVSYVVCRDKNVYMKFAKDPNFQILFNCGNVTIFQVTK